MFLSAGISFLVLFFTNFECLNLDNADLKIEIILQRRNYALTRSTGNSTKICFDICGQFCVSIRLRLHEDFLKSLKGRTLETYDLVITEDVLFASVSSLDWQPSALIQLNTSKLEAGISAQKSSWMKMTSLPLNAALSPAVLEFLLLYFRNVETNIVVVFHDDSTAQVVGDLLDYLSDQGVGVEVLVYSTPALQTRAQWVLSRIHKLLYSRGIYCLLLGLPETVVNTLRIINSFDGHSNRTTNFRHLSHWLVLTDVVSPDIYLSAVDSLENVALVDIHTHGRQVINIKEIWATVRACINTYFNSATLKDNCRSVEELKTDFTRYIKKVINITTKDDNVTVWALTGVGNVSLFHTVDIQYVESGHRMSDILYPNKKYQWNGVHLLISTKPWPGYVRKVTNGNQTKYDGMCLEILDSMVDALNFTYTIEDVPDGEWGSIVNDSWTGMVRQLKDRVIDLAVTDLGVHSSRDTVMDYVYPTFKTAVIDVLYRFHGDSDISLDRLTTPIKPVVIPIMVGSLCAVTALYVAVEYADVVMEVRGRRGRIVLLFWKAVWYLIGSILAQGGAEKPRSCSGRLLMATWWLFCIIFAAMYSATLTVSFCVQRSLVPFTSLQDMVYNSNYKWGMFNGSINMLHFGTSEIPLYKTTFRRMMKFSQSDPSVLSKDFDVQLDKVVNDKYAFISSRNTLNVMIQRAPKGVTLTTLGETLYPSSVAFGVPTNSPLLPEFERVMRRIKENGFLQHWIRIYWNDSKPTTIGFQLGGEPLPLKKTVNAFYLMGLGIAAAITALICETMLKIIGNKVKNKLRIVQKRH